MEEGKQGAKAWTDAEKLGLLFQIIEKAGPIPWDSVALPEGRTRKACIVMVDKEKSKVKKAREAAGEVVEAPPKSTPTTKGKRKAEGEPGTPASSVKKAKGRKKAGGEDQNGEGDEEAKAEGEIKAEVEEEVLS